ncbi:MAG: serine hydrolase domain-containing protein [Gemmatimonadales bacterium]
MRAASLHSLMWLLSQILLAPAWRDAAAAQQPAPPASRDLYPHHTEPIGTVRQIYDGALSPALAVNTFRNIHRLFATRTVPASSDPLPLPDAAVPLANVRFRDHGGEYDLNAYLELNRVAALLVLHEGRVKLERYRYGNTTRTRWMSMSIAKSITSTLIGAAMEDGFIESLSDSVTRYVPALAGSAYDGVSIRDVLMMASGVRWNETYTDPRSDRRRLLEAQIAQRPGSLMAVMRDLPRAAEPGTVYNYNTGETQVAAEVLRAAVRRPLATYLAERIWRPFGMEADATWWLESPGGIEIGGSGFSATLRDYGRFGLFVLGGGIAAGDSVLPADWVHEATTPRALRDGTRIEYGYLWWPAETPASRRDDAFMAMGIHGQYLYVNRAAQVVIVAWGARPHPTEGQVIDDWVFCDAVTAAVRSR